MMLSALLFLPWKYTKLTSLRNSLIASVVFSLYLRSYLTLMLDS